MAESFLSFLWFVNSKSFGSNNGRLSGQHTIQWRSWQSQTHWLQNTGQKRSSILVTGVDLNVWYQTGVSSITPVLSGNWFYSSLLTPWSLLVLHGTGGHSAWGYAQLFWFQATLQLGKYVPHGDPWKLSLSLQSLCSSCPGGQRTAVENCFFTVQTGVCVDQHCSILQNTGLASFFFSVITGILCF